MSGWVGVCMVGLNLVTKRDLEKNEIIVKSYYESREEG